MSRESLLKQDTNMFDKFQKAKNKIEKIYHDIHSFEIEYFDLPQKTNPRKIAALDGGGFSKSYTGLTIIPARAAGAIFEQDKKPHWESVNDVEILTISDDPKNYGALFRDYLELQIAQKLAQKKPEILFLDGSISNFAYKGIPRSLLFTIQEGKEVDESIAGYRFYELFVKFIQIAYELINYCILNNIILVGVSKDSRANILTKKLFSQKKKKPPPINDTTLVSILAQGKTGFTKPIKYRPRLRKTREEIWKAAKVFQEKKLRSFYMSYFILKKDAQPIRVDSLIPQKEYLAEIQEAMVTYHDGNGFFIPAYLSHKRAHMTPELGNRICNSISQQLLKESPELYKTFFHTRRRETIQ